jgi:hypothetical protein
MRLTRKSSVETTLMAMLLSCSVITDHESEKPGKSIGS